MTSINYPDTELTRIEKFLRMLLTLSGLNLTFQIGPRPAQSPPNPSSAPDIVVEFTGPDTPLLVSRNGELLHAIEHLAAKVLRFEPEQHDRISFDAENFKLLRQRELELIAEAAIEKVRASRLPYAFPPMNSRERRLLHLALSSSGLATASSGLGPRRFVVLYPEGQQPVESPQPPSTPDRTRAVRNTFRRRS